MRRLPKPMGYHLDRKTMVARADGRRACRFCKGPVQPPRRTFCSDACVVEWKCFTDPAELRQAILRRDGGVCAACGLPALTREPAWIERQLYLTELAARRPGQDWRHWKTPVSVQPDGSLWPRQHWIDMMTLALEWRAEHKIGPDQSAWEADHIIEIADGGAVWDRSNVATLCTPCHRRKSAASATARAARRRAERQGAAT